ncbi:MAG: transglycosylase domain-containing protein [Lachnospiraceae bacterium]|nr:transglycosylase domain-containing protein [Lachnospiraceae bacterium]
MDYSREGIKRKQRQLSSKGTKIKKMLGINLIKAIMICLFAGVVIGACLGIGMFRGILASTPSMENIDVTPTGYATNLYDSEGHQLTKLVAENSNRTYVSIDRVPQVLCDAFVAVEDRRFYQHNGIDIEGIMRAAAIGLKNRNFKQGASTITQQLIKNNVFDKWTAEKGFDKYRRKIQEQFLAMELEKTLDKRQILELYMNTINLGHNTLGVQAASMRYFGKPVHELNLSEAATIAGITQNPSANDPILHPEGNAKRRKKVLDDMLELGYINQAEYDDAMADDVYARITATNVLVEEESVYSYFEDAVIDVVAKDLTEKFIADGYVESQASAKAYNLLYSGGLSIYTTQDSRIQAICDEIYSDEANYPDNTHWYLNYRVSIRHSDGEVENHSTEMFRKFFREKGNPKFNMIYATQDDAYAAIQEYLDAVMKPGDEVAADSISLTPQPQVSLTVADHTTGHVLAMIGGRGAKETSRSLNRAFTTTRQPGSCFKVVAAYAPALDSAGLTLADVFVDAPFKYTGGRPVANWYGEDYKGICSLRYGIEQSLNIIAVKTLTVVRPELGFDYLKSFGFTTLVERQVNSQGEVMSDINQALALGGITKGITNLELNAAYGTIANGGMYMEPLLYTRIVDHDGNLLIDKTQSQDQHRVIKETTAFLLTDAMVDVVTKGTGGAVNFGGMAMAGKTGTTTSYKDVWFAGFTPYYTATCWTGYDNNEDLPGTDRKLSQTMWRAVMSRLHENLEYRSFEVPAGITMATVCSKSGKLPIPGLCDDCVRTEYFAEGTVPHETCNVHYAGNVCMATGLPADAMCPFCVEGVVTLNPPEPQVLWAGSDSTDEYHGTSCPHNAEFFADPNHRAILEQQRDALEAMGIHFDID